MAGFFGQLGTELGNGASQVGNVFTGTSGDSGITGLGQFKGQTYDPNADVYGNTQSAERQAQFAQQLAASQQRTAPTMSGAVIDQNPQNQFRQQQMGLANALQAQSMGQGPSLAQSQLRQGTDRNIAQAIALQASQRGTNPGQGMRQIAQTTAAANQQAAQQAADLRMQEQLAARQQLAGVTSSGRGQDIGLATDQAQLSQAANIANQQAALQQAALNDQMARFYNTGLSDMTQQDRSAQMALEQLRAQQSLGVQGINQKGYEAAGKARGDYISNLAEGGGSLASLMAFSDKDLKKDISEGKEDVKTFLEQIKPYTYKYKNEAHGEGEHISPMAQDLEKTQIGKSLVVDTPEGKIVNYGKAGGVMLASASMLNDRLSELEKKITSVFKERRRAS